MRKPVLCRMRSLISVFVVCCWDSIIPILAKSKISRHWLVSVVCCWAGQFEAYLVGKIRRQIFSWRGSLTLTVLFSYETNKFPVSVAEQEKIDKWATTWQNQQNECAPSEDLDQPGHPSSLIRVFNVRSVGSHEPKQLSSCGQRRLWSDWRMPWLIWVFAGYTLTLLVLSCRGSNGLLISAALHRDNYLGSYIPYDISNGFTIKSMFLYIV